LNIAATTPEELPIRLYDVNHINIAKLSYQGGKETISMPGSSKACKLIAAFQQAKLKAGNGTI
jgi:hypothetical protein